MFTKFTLDYKQNLFPELLQQTNFDTVTKGRLGAILVSPKNNTIPIIRTTTKYTIPAQKFKPIHYDLIEKIKQKSSLSDIGFNNAMIEVYDNSYCTMGFHSDQAIDLADDSYIAIYSCYENPTTMPRKLIVKTKTANESVEITMAHNSVILFHTTTNQEHLHKIILDNPGEPNRWLGITFRLSKTFIHFIDNIPFINKDILNLASEEETKNFYKLRGEENKSTQFKYPDLTYTISPSDLMQIIV